MSRGQSRSSMLDTADGTPTRLATLTNTLCYLDVLFCVIIRFIYFFAMCVPSNSSHFLFFLHL